MFQLHGFIMPVSFNTNKVLYVAEAIGQPYQGINLNFAEGENKASAHLKRHPLGKTPTLTHGDKILFESGTICKYMASVAGSSLYPVKDHFKRAQVDQWMDFFTAHMGRWCSTALFESYFKQKFGMGEKDEKAFTEALNFFNQQAEMLNTHLSDKKYLCGDNMTIADIFAFSYLENTGVAGLSLADYSNVNNWVNAMADQPFIAEVKSKFYS